MSDVVMMLQSGVGKSCGYAVDGANTSANLPP